MTIQFLYHLQLEHQMGERIILKLMRSMLWVIRMLMILVSKMIDS